MTRYDCDQVINKYKDFLSVFPEHQILGSYGRGEIEVGDLDILFNRDLFDLNKYKSFKDLIKANNIFLERDDIRILVKGHLGTIKIEAYGVESKYLSAFSCLMIGPHDRYDLLIRDAKKRGYYMTHFGLLKSNEILTQELAERICFESEDKILFDTPQKYEDFIYKQHLDFQIKEFNVIKNHWKSEYFFCTERSFYIEPTTRCNSNCIMCTRRSTSPSDLSFDSFKFILDKIEPLHVKFWGRGESLIHKDCWRMINEMKKRAITVYLTTNFNLDIDWESISNVDVIYISLHTFNEENYFKITGRKINQVLDNILKAKELDLNIVLKAVVQEINKNDIDEFKEIADKHGIKCVTTNVRHIGLPKKKDYCECNQPNFPFIAANGDIHPCCMTPGKIGNIFQDNIDYAIINSAKARKLHRCQTCELN